MAAEKILFHIDEFVIDGAPSTMEDGTATITGAARYENTVVPTAGDGDDFQSRKRVATTARFKLQFGKAQKVSDYTKITDAQISCRDKVTGKRALMPRCAFGSMGEIGGGSVDVTFNVLAPIQWL